MAAIGGATIPGAVYAWVVVFLLPLNSAINPLLYTISAIKIKFPKKKDTSDSFGSKSVGGRGYSNDLMLKGGLFQTEYWPFLWSFIRPVSSIYFMVSSVISTFFSDFLYAQWLAVGENSEYQAGGFIYASVRSNSHSINKLNALNSKYTVKIEKNGYGTKNHSKESMNRDFEQWKYLSMLKNRSFVRTTWPVWHIRVFWGADVWVIMIQRYVNNG